jgi:probable F420-dependent oxidoreductase
MDLPLEPRLSFGTIGVLPGAAASRAATAQAEALGLDTLWVGDHVAFPLPILDPLLQLAQASAFSERLRFGTSVYLLPLRHPTLVAKQVATLDHLCGGRFVFGVGAGWNVAEMNNHGVAFEDRWRQLTERLEALKTLWREERARFAGNFVRFDDVWLYPKPVQRPHPPILLGTLDTPFGRGLVAKHADAWMPIALNLDYTRNSLADVRARMRALGRDDSKLAISMLFLAEREQTQQTLAQTRDLGVERAILRLPVADEPTVLRTLDRYARMAS